LQIDNCGGGGWAQIKANETISYELGDCYEVWFPNADGQMLSVRVRKDVSQEEYEQALQQAVLEARN